MLQMTSSDVAVPRLLKKYELSLSSGQSMFRLPQCFSLSVTCTYTCPVLVKVVCRRFRIVYILLSMMLFVRSQSFISPPRFMFVSAAVSEYTIMLATYICSTTILSVHTYHS